MLLFKFKVRFLLFLFSVVSKLLFYINIIIFKIVLNKTKIIYLNFVIEIFFVTF